MTGLTEDTEIWTDWHPGERHLQERAGVAGRLSMHQLRGFMTDQHRLFFNQRPFMVVGAVDESGRPWASLLAGPVGFVQAPSPRRLILSARPDASDPLTAGLRVGAELGLLGIEFATRRRNRVNGRIAALDDGGITLAVEQAFGNCPKYIGPQDYSFTAARGPAASVRSDDAAVRACLARADRFFLVTSSTGGVDVSHRGGPAGFIEADPLGGLLIPDYPGNNYFNSLGNLLLNPRAGLLIPDPVSGALLHLTGRAEILWADSPTPPQGGPGRGWRFIPEAGLLRQAVLAQG